MVSLVDRQTDRQTRKRPFVRSFVRAEVSKPVSCQVSACRSQLFGTLRPEYYSLRYCIYSLSLFVRVCVFPLFLQLSIEPRSHRERSRAFFWNNAVAFHEPPKTEASDTAQQQPVPRGDLRGLVRGALPNWEFSNTPGRAVPCADHGSDDQPDAMIF